MRIKTFISIGFLSLSMLIVTQTALAAALHPIGSAQADRREAHNRATHANSQVQPLHSSSRDRSIDIRSLDSITMYVYLPLIAQSDVCAATGETYAALPPINPYTGDASTQPDMNIAVRGYTPTTAYLGLVDYAGEIDPLAPQLYTLFEDNRTPIFNAAYQIYRWDWNCNCRGGPILKWDVTLLGMQTTPGEVLHAPIAGYDVGSGYGTLVLYAEANRITLQYTRDDSPADGYTIHMENVCVDPDLLALYQTSNANGRNELPALLPGQAFGRAPGYEIDAATRSNGSLLDPRTRKEWWQGR